MMKTLTAGLTALSLILVPATPVHADSRQDEINRTILSLLAIGAIGLAIKNNADNRSNAKSSAPETREHRQVHDRHSWGQNRRHADLLPGRCFRRVEDGRGGYQAVYSGRCLERRYRDANTLPRQCAVRMGGADGRRVGYDAGCLRDFGYRTDRRWN